MSARKLHIALLLDSVYLPAWQCLLIERVLQVADVRLVIVTGEHSPFRQQCLMAWLYGLRYFDRLIFKTGADALSMCSLTDRVPGVPCLPLAAAQTRAQFMDAKIDLVLDLANRGQSGAGYTADLPDYLTLLPSLGRWHYFYSDGQTHHLAWAGINEYVQPGAGEVLAGVWCHSRYSPERHCLFMASTSTDPSLSLTVNAVLWRMADFVPDLLAQASANPAASAAPFIQQSSQRWAPLLQEYLSTRRPTRSAGGMLCARLTGRCLLNVLQVTYAKFTLHRHWVLLEQASVNPLSAMDTLASARQLSPPAGHFWADPCLIEHEGQPFIFFEDFVFKQKRGRLACMQLYANGQHSEPAIILERPYHLSYPFVFRYQDNYYLIPESAENRSVDIYRCERFPDRWVYVKTLLAAVDAYDASVYPHAGRWWMFVNLRQHPDSSPHDSLYLFSAQTPLDAHWEPHPCNPIVTQASRARSAGCLFMQDGCIYRPSQNCAGSYGRGLNLNQVIEWNSQSYKEKIINQCIPAGAGGLDGIHTFSFGSGRVISDGIQVRKRWFASHAK